MLSHSSFVQNHNFIDKNTTHFSAFGLWRKLNANVSRPTPRWWLALGNIPIYNFHLGFLNNCSRMASADSPCCSMGLFF